MSPTLFSTAYAGSSPVKLLSLIVALIRFANSVSTKANGTSSSFLATGGPYTTLTHPNVSMCQVEPNGLGGVEDGGPPDPDVYSTACSCSALTTIKDPNYLPPQDCCIKCWITARDVQIFYWPVDTDTKSLTNTSAPTTSRPQSLITNGITFISPSVYVAYRNIAASDVCPGFEDGFTRGRAYNTTIAYEPGDLSTSICTGVGNFDDFTALNVTALQHSTTYNGSCLGQYASMYGTTNGPYLSIREDLTLLDPAWSTCIAVYWGVFDPPIALHTATALVPDPGKGSPPTPAPGSPVALPHAPATPTAPSTDHGKPATHSPAPKADPQGSEQQNSPDPVKPSASDPEADPQNPDKQKPDLPDPVQLPPHNDNDDPATSAAIPIPPNGGNVAQGSPKVVSDPKSNDPQPTGAMGEGDPGTDPGNGHNAGPTLDPAENLGQSPAESAQPLPSMGGHQIQAASGGGIIVASTPLQPGVQTIIDSTPVSVDKGLGGQVTTVDGQIVQPLSDGISIAGISLTAGAPPIMISGTRVSLGASALVIGTGTFPVALNTLPLVAGQITTIAGEAVQRLSNGISVAGTTLTPGAPPITVSGTPVSLGSLALVVGSSTISLPAEAPTPFVTTVASEAITAAPNAVEVAGSTLSPGAPGVTIGGTPVSLDSAGELVVGSKTIALDGSSGGGLGGLTMGGFGVGGPFPSPGSPSVPGNNSTLGLGNGTALGVQPFQGNAHDLKSYIPGKLSTSVMIAIIVLFCGAR